MATTQEVFTCVHNKSKIDVFVFNKVLYKRQRLLSNTFPIQNRCQTIENIHNSQLYLHLQKKLLYITNVENALIRIVHNNSIKSQLIDTFLCCQISLQVLGQVSMEL